MQLGTLPMELANSERNGFVQINGGSARRLGQQSIINKALEIVAEESGVARGDMKDSTELASIGIDSLLSLIITSRFKEELDFDTGTGCTIFEEFTTLGDLKEGLLKFTGASTTDSTASSSIQGNGTSVTSDTPQIMSPNAEKEQHLIDPNTETYTTPEPNTTEQDPPTYRCRPCYSVLIQGSTQNQKQSLFLFPDGSGSAQSYVNIPPVNKELTIFGLISPYRQDPEEKANCTLDSLVASYITEIRRRQPKGPYNFGGWSSGGILAYRAASKLISEGEQVHSLVLIDSPAPNGMDRLPARFYEHCKSVGVFSQIERRNGTNDTSPPAWLVPHFNATIDMLHDYHATPLPEGSIPKISIFWASECVLDGVQFPKLAPGPDDTQGMKFLTENRTDFTAGGWKRLFPGSLIRVGVGAGANHFSMMVIFPR